MIAQAVLRCNSGMPHVTLGRRHGRSGGLAQPVARGIHVVAGLIAEGSGMGRYLVTGGAGFVGSHLVLALLERNDTVVVLDNLRTGHRGAVLPGARLVVGDLADATLVDGLVGDGPWDAVFHFASRSLVGESMQAPLSYFMDNVSGALILIDACVRHGVRRFVLSSTAALFGTPDRLPIDESAVIAPSSPYGESKRMIERALFWADQVHGLRSAYLRYFNAAGADPGGRLGEDHDPETHLIPLAIDAALGRRPPLVVFGLDYPTADGTCVRDYVHVSDLAAAHLLVLEPLRERSVAYNLGNGAGHSVLAVVAMVSEVIGRAVPVTPGTRRAGDPASLVAASGRIRSDVGWCGVFSGLEAMVRTAAEWRVAHPGGYSNRLTAPCV